MAKRGRKSGPTLLCDEWIENRANYLHETGIPLKTAIQYAVDDLRKYIVLEKDSRERYSTDEQYQEHMLEIQAMESVLTQDSAKAVRATKRKTNRRDRGWAVLDATSAPSSLLGPPDTAGSSETVKRNYERMASKSR